MGGKRAVLTPTRTLPHQGGGEQFEGATHEIPTLVSVKGEGSDFKPAHMQYLPCQSLVEEGSDRGKSTAEESWDAEGHGRAFTYELEGGAVC
jgi:hypothetical protein